MKFGIVVYSYTRNILLIYTFFQKSQQNMLWTISQFFTLFFEISYSSYCLTFQILFIMIHQYTQNNISIQTFFQKILKKNLKTKKNIFTEISNFLPWNLVLYIKNWMVNFWIFFKFFFIVKINRFLWNLA